MQGMTSTVNNVTTTQLDAVANTTLPSDQSFAKIKTS